MLGGVRRLSPGGGSASLLTLVLCGSPPSSPRLLSVPFSPDTRSCGPPSASGARAQGGMAFPYPPPRHNIPQVSGSTGWISLFPLPGFAAQGTDPRTLKVWGKFVPLLLGLCRFSQPTKQSRIIPCLPPSSFLPHPSFLSSPSSRKLYYHPALPSALGAGAGSHSGRLAGV